MKGKKWVEKNKGNLEEKNLICENLEEVNLQGARLCGTNLAHANLAYANLQETNLSYTNLVNAYLFSADLRKAFLLGTNLQDASLEEADLREAEFWDANLKGANLKGANLQGNISCLPTLYFLKMQPPDTILYFWKPIIPEDSHFYDHQNYEVGKTYLVDDYEVDERILECKGKKSTVATLLWCLQNHRDAKEFIEVEIKIKDIVAIPFATSGEFTVKKFKVVRKITREQGEKLLKDIKEK